MSPAAIDAMLAAGASAEVIAAAWKAEIAAQSVAVETRRAKDRVRQQRRRHAESRGVTRTERDKGSNDKDILTSKAQVSEPSGSSPSPRPWALPVGVSLQVWTDLMTNRKRKRLPNTPTAWKAFNDDLELISIQTGIPPPKLIEMCTAKGWGAIYDPRDNRNERNDNPLATAVQRLSASH